MRNILIFITYCLRGLQTIAFFLEIPSNFQTSLSFVYVKHLFYAISSIECSTDKRIALTGRPLKKHSLIIHPGPCLLKTKVLEELNILFISGQVHV